jgi:hypothetical protein
MPPPLLSRTKTFEIIEQPTSGVEPAGLDGSSNAHAVPGVGAGDSSRVDARNEYARELEDGTITAKPHLTGSRRGELHRTVECAGRPLASAGAGPKWHLFLRAMGFGRTALKRVTVGTFTGTAFPRGTLVYDNATPASATKSVRVVKISGTTLYYLPVTGSALADTDTLHDGAGASVPVDSSPADAGYRFTPQTQTDTFEPLLVTVQERHGGERHTRINCRARGSIMLNRDEPPKIRAEFVGCPVYTAQGTPREDATPMSGVPAAVVPQVVLNCAVAVSTPAGPATVILTGIEMSVDNTLEQRQTIGPSAADSGHLETMITERAVTLRIEPEHNPADFDVVGAATRGDLLSFTVEVGSPSGTSGLLIVQTGAAQVTGDLSPGNRNSLSTYPLTLRATGNGDDELVIDHVEAA